MRRTLDLDLVPARGYVGDEQPLCPFLECNGSVMQLDDCGELVCPDCRTSAGTIESIAHDARLAEVAS